ncbi:lipoprotein [Spiroplasma alleghenense]|uniref:Lipoprotein n=1 Tax=Spiroplasma alleghenense TaxID=216931 RepID=A0A345Z568_9MOLU|nr:lipoprotein [Spiroplasma alleghenense]AXK51747.1 hypothetical protein SALLE_v1c10770 [Spiroplasma alleghenense]
MKKLLSILAASTLTITTPLSVISCSPKKIEEKNEYDFDEIRKELIEKLQLALNQNINNDFKDIFYLSEPKSNEVFKYSTWSKMLSLSEKNQTLELNSKTTAFKEISSELRDRINWQVFLNAVQTEILSNVNYKPILVDGKNPFTQGFEISKIQLVNQEDMIIALHLGLETQIEILDNANEKIYETLKTNILINYIAENDEIPDANEIEEFADQVTNQVQESRASDFAFKSNAGGSDKILEDIKNNSNYEEIFSEVISEEAENQNNSNFKNLKFKSGSGLAQGVAANSIFADTGSQTYWWANEEEQNEMLRAAMLNGGEDIKNLVTAISDDTQNIWTVSYENDWVTEQINGDTQYGKIFNIYILEFFLYKKNDYNANKLLELIEKENSKFMLDSTVDEGVIGVVPTYINDAKLEFKNLSGTPLEIALPKTFFISKQTTTYSGSRELLEKFITANIDFQREFFQMDKVKAQYESLDFAFFKKPKNLAELKTDEFILTESNQYFETIFETAYEDAALKNPDIIDFVNAYWIYGGSGNRFGEYFKIDDAGGVYFYNKNTYDDNYQMVSKRISVQAIHRRTTTTASLYNGKFNGTNRFYSEFFYHFQNQEFGKGSNFKLID